MSKYYADERGQQPEHDRDAQREPQALEREHPGRGRRHRRSRQPSAAPVYADAGQYGNCADWMEPRIHAIQVVSNYSVLHFYFEIITGWSGNCVIKQLEMHRRSWPPAAV
jgi:hypothetical protein